MSNERRAWVRHECSRPIPREVRIDDTEHLFDGGWVLNLSVGGLGVIMPQEVSLGTRLVVQLESRPQDEPVELRVCVVRAERQEDGEWLIGCQFDGKLSEVELQAILL